MIANDKIGQTPAEFYNVIDNIFKFFGMNFHKVNKIFFQHTNQHNFNLLWDIHFLVSPCVLPCYKIIPIKNSVRAQDDNFAGFNILLEKFIKNLFRINSWLMNLNGSAKASHL